METQLKNYYHQYGEDISDNVAVFYGGYICSQCGQWVADNVYHICPSAGYWPHYIYPNKTEQAYSLLKKLVEKKIVEEPKSYQDFCNLLEAIKEIL